MSSFDLSGLRAAKSESNRVTRRICLALGLAASVLLVTGCQVRPLSGTIGAGGAPAQAQLSAIEISSIDSDGLSRVGQELRNELIFGFQRGGEAPPALYSLKVLIDKVQNEVGVEKLADVPSAYTVTLNATFVLSEIATDKTLTTGKAFATASYDFSSQRFANLRAERDAENRAAKVLASDIQTRLAGYFATQTQ